MSASTFFPEKAHSSASSNILSLIDAASKSSKTSASMMSGVFFSFQGASAETMICFPLEFLYLLRVHRYLRGRSCVCIPRSATLVVGIMVQSNCQTCLIYIDTTLDRIDNKNLILDKIAVIYRRGSWKLSICHSSCRKIQRTLTRSASVSE